MQDNRVLHKHRGVNLVKRDKGSTKKEKVAALLGTEKALQVLGKLRKGLLLAVGSLRDFTETVAPEMGKL